MRKITAHEVALSAMACALSTIFLALGNITSVLLFTAYLVASIALSLPLAKGSYRGFALAYAATVLLTLLLIGSLGFIVELLPFILFFGLHPLFNELQLKWRVNKYLAFGIKAVWFDGAMYLFWRLILQMTTVAWIDQYILPVILVGGTAFFWMYDFVMFRVRGQVFALVRRITK